MRIMSWMCGVTKTDKIMNENESGLVKVAPTTKKITEKKLT